ncbi:MAG TPA: energy transducer TonB [Balneolales bacterium]|nr:energy transducer TonB [Balneolales bacterium]
MIAPNQRTPENGLKLNYQIHLEIGFIISLLILITLFKIKFNPQTKIHYTQQAQETVKMEDVIQTKQTEAPPPPPAPQTPVAVPNDEVINDTPISLNTELDLSGPIALPDNPPAQPKADTEENDKNTIFVVVERMPKLIGGLDNFQKTVEYPKLAKEAGIEGRVYVKFVINEKGNVVNPKVVRGIGGGCDQAAIEAVKKAKFVPGLQRGKPVKVWYTMPIYFKLQK